MVPYLFVEQAKISINFGEKYLIYLQEQNSEQYGQAHAKFHRLFVPLSSIHNNSYRQSFYYSSILILPEIVAPKTPPIIIKAAHDPLNWLPYPEGHKSC